MLFNYWSTEILNVEIIVSNMEKKVLLFSKRPFISGLIDPIEMVVSLFKRVKYNIKNIICRNIKKFVIQDYKY